MNHYKKHDWLNDTAKKAHENAANKGFYEGEFSTIESRKSKAFLLRQKNLIRSEIGEGYEALRKGRIDVSIAELNRLYEDFQQGELTFPVLYGLGVKGTLAEELADVAIRALDCAGALQIKFSQEGDTGRSYWKKDESMDSILDFFYTLCDSFFLGEGEDWGIDAMHYLSLSIRELIMYSFDVANHYNIDLDKHIELKMLYNSMREHKHGKNF